MRNEEKEPLDPNTPALVVTYGNASRKYRPLDADLLVLGRSPVCNIHLVSPDVAPVHCVLFRGAAGWQVRDCSGRPGTRVNGRVVQEALLGDGDIIQVGAFSFEMRLPGVPGAQGTLPAPILIGRLQRSRRALVRLALRFRKRLAERAQLKQTEARLKQERAELTQQVEALRVNQREYELRMTRLELSERDLATDRATLEKEYKALQEETQQHTASVQLFEQRAARLEKELEERRAALLAEVQKQAEVERPAPAPAPAPTEQTEQAPQESLLAQAEATFRKQQTELDRLVRDLRQVLALARAGEIAERKRGSGHRERLSR
ncbi:MAG TPA: FHA domain-containing protein [Gemmataceae bacterium]|nr:FHA domain-containing protein [Gemmataceae bacterium]